MNQKHIRETQSSWDVNALMFNVELNQSWEFSHPRHPSFSLFHWNIREKRENLLRIDEEMLLSTFNATRRMFGWKNVRCKSDDKAIQSYSNCKASGLHWMTNYIIIIMFVHKKMFEFTSEFYHDNGHSQTARTINAHKHCSQRNNLHFIMIMMARWSTHKINIEENWMKMCDKHCLCRTSRRAFNVHCFSNIQNISSRE